MAGGRTRTRTNTDRSKEKMTHRKKNKTNGVAPLTNTRAGIDEESIEGHVSESSDETAKEFAKLALMVKQLLQKVGTVAQKIDTVEGKIETGDSKLAQKIDTLEGKLAQTIETVESKLAQTIDAVEETVEKLDNKMKENPPVNSVRKGGPEGGMSDMTSCDYTVGDAAKSVLRQMEGAVSRDLKDYIKKNWYSRIKFPQTDKVSMHICQKAAMERMLLIPKTINDTLFFEYFKKYVTKSLAALRHNSQTLARKNWLGKKNERHTMSIDGHNIEC